MEEYEDRLKTKLKGGIAIGSGSLGLYSLFYPGLIVEKINEYIPIPEGEICGVPYITAIGITMGVAEIIGGVLLLADD